MMNIELILLWGGPLKVWGGVGENKKKNEKALHPINFFCYIGRAKYV